MSGEVRSLTDLLDRASARRYLEAPAPEDLGQVFGREPVRGSDGAHVVACERFSRLDIAHGEE
jgi:hypothetical protein